MCININVYMQYHTKNGIKSCIILHKIAPLQNFSVQSSTKLFHIIKGLMFSTFSLKYK